MAARGAGKRQKFMGTNIVIHVGAAQEKFAQISSSANRIRRSLPGNS